MQTRIVDFFLILLFSNRIRIKNKLKMNKNKTLSTAAILLVILGISMIYIGGFYAPKVMLPPIITGVGFFIIAWVLNVLKK